MSIAEPTALGLRLVAEQLATQGMLVHSIDDRWLPAPQIWFSKAGRSAVVFVSVNPTKTFGQLDETTQDEWLDAFEGYREKGHETYVATISLVDGETGNELTAGALVGIGTVEFTFSGLERIE
ncbi:MAG: hypothetical protein A3E01_05830 [Gammaproteobacteria bacterium RIFCSPHIGHO2_12_FULL_63_22]|nr:MAG: hypothetical protein A3E01_05830 [Gammaproteobacteria bacterium RIFCSPHIGHO2_12_FULL_63_22]